MQKVILYLITLSAVFSSSISMGQSDPVDRNFPGVFLGANLGLGQARENSADGSGIHYSSMLELGYVAKRDTWGRIEFSLGLELSESDLRDLGVRGQDVKVAFGPAVIAKLGYGYSLGSHTFGVWRIGVGLGSASYDGKVSTKRYSADDEVLLAQVGWDAVFLMSRNVSLTAGLYFRHTSSNFGVIEKDNGQIDVGSVEFNSLALQFGGRYQL